MLTSRGNYNSLAGVTPDKGYPRKNLVTLTGYPLWKDPIHMIEITEPRGYKAHYKVSDHLYTENSHGEEKLKFINTWMNRPTNTKKMLKIQTK